MEIYQALKEGIKKQCCCPRQILEKKKIKMIHFPVLRNIYVYFCLDICRDGGREPKVKLFSFLMVEIIPIKQILC